MVGTDTLSSRAPKSCDPAGASTQPQWFTKVLQHEPERVRHQVAGADIEILAWGERGKPGLLFLHGMLAHADWWSFIAPFFAQDFRVAAISWSGMGDSDHRSEYALETWLQEARECAMSAGLFDSPHRPLVVAHSFGAFVASRMAASHGDEFAGVVLLDLPLRTPEQRTIDLARKASAPQRPIREQHEARDLASALARFRLRPEQTTDNGFIVDYIARKSLKPIGAETAPGALWTWKFDPKVVGNPIGDPARSVSLAQCPLAFMWGADSRLVGQKTLAYFKQVMRRPDTPMIALPAAQHHVMIDQPLALVTVLRGLFSTWPANSFNANALALLKQ